MRKLLLALALVGLATLGAGQSFAGTTYETISAWDHSSSISSFGNPNTATYGQTFVAPSTDTILNDFTFNLNGSGNGVHLSIGAYVYAWTGPLQGNGGIATGPALYAAPSLLSYTDNNTFQALTANTGGVNLVAGSQYVMFFSVSAPADFANSNGSVAFGFTFNTHSANNGGGGFVFTNNGSDTSLWTSTDWDTISDFGDLAFSANFSSASVATPEPATIGLAAICIISGLAYRRRLGNKTTA